MIGDQGEQRFQAARSHSGLFLLVALGLVLLVAAASLVRQGYFTPTTRLHFFAASGAGLGPGMAVQLSGFKVGTVEDLLLESDARVRVQLSVQTRYMRHITQDSEARLSREGLIGASFIEIIPAGKDARPMPANGVLRFSRAGDLAEMAQSLNAKLHPILNDIRALTHSLQDPDGDLRQTLAGLRQATGEVARLRAELGGLAGTVGRRVESIGSRAETLLEGANTTLATANDTLSTATDTLKRSARAIDGLNESVGTLNSQLPTLMLRLDNTLSTVDATVNKAGELVGEMREDLPPAVRAGRALAEDGREIMEGARRSWPLRLMLPPPLGGPLPLDSYDTPPAARP